MPRWLRFAHALSQHSTHPQQQMAAVVVRGGAVLSSAVNSSRWGHHAERRALRPHRDYRGAVVYVMRANRRASGPCPNCLRVLRRAGIAKVVYIDEGLAIQERKL